MFPSLSKLNLLFELSFFFQGFVYESRQHANVTYKRPNLFDAGTKFIKLKAY